jgi:lipopolysaccharide export LptBFGC system permease protein LptF
MAAPNQKARRWYLVMVFCILLSFFVFVVGPRIGHDISTSHDIALMIGLWAPTLGVLGLRAEAMAKKD